MAATTVKEYLDSLPADRRRAIQSIRKVIRANIDKDFEEGIQYGVIGYYLPHSKYPAGYHCDPKQPLPFAGIASQKHHIGLYLFCIYGNGDEEARFRKEWLATGKRLDMGKSCVRFKKLEDVPLEVIGRAFQRMTAKKFVAFYEAALAGAPARRKAGSKKKAAKKKTATKKAVKQKAATKKTAKKKTAKKKAAKKKAAKKQAAKKQTAKKKTATKKAGSRAAARKKAGARKVAARKAARRSAR